MQRDIRLNLPHPVPAGGAQQQSEGGGARRGRRRAETVEAAPDPAGAVESSKIPEGYKPRLRDMYENTVVAALTEEFEYDNVMRVPTITRITLNIGEGDAQDNARALEGIQRDLTTIAGQKPVVTKATKSIAQFQIREGNNIGAKVTLRGFKMWDFLDRLMNVALPRTRDFRGVSRNAFDGRGDYSLGIREQTIFPEIDYNRIDKIRGMQVNIVTSANNDQEGRRLLELMGMPFVREAENNG
jgi:large subunit ribosomal protein L5